MRDLERIREVHEYRVTGPQARSLLLAVVVAGAALFVGGVQIGRLNAPVDAALLAPVGGSQDAHALLADLLARQTDPALASTAPGGGRPSGLAVSDESGAAAHAEQGDPAAGGSPDNDPAGEGTGLSATDSTVPAGAGAPDPLPGLPSDADSWGLLGPGDGASEPVGDTEERRPLRVVEVVEPSFAHEPVPALPTAAPPAVTAITPPPPSRPPSAAAMPGPPSGKGFTVQLGAYESLDEARAVYEALRAKGISAWHTQAEVSGKTWHRVRVGLFDRREDADAAAADLANATPFPPFVTRQP